MKSARFNQTILKTAFWKIRIKKIIRINVGIVKTAAKKRTIDAPMSIRLAQEKKIIDLSSNKIPIITKKIGNIDILIAKNNKRNATMKSSNPSILTSIRLKRLFCLNNL